MAAKVAYEKAVTAAVPQWKNGVMPTRFMYHSDVRQYNPENHKIAADRIGGDDIHTKVWWEK